MGELKKGWTYKTSSTKRHYFVKGVSLCGKYKEIYTGGLLRNWADEKTRCKECYKALQETRT